MIDIDYIQKLLVLLNHSKVSSFKSGGLELEFFSGPSSGVPEKIEPSSPSALIEVPIDESKIPVELRADALMNQDNILNWSAPPSANEQSMPLTGDEPLTEGG